MKFLVLIPDGSADHIRGDLGGKTALQAASTPNLDRLARFGKVGLVRTVPEGFPPGSDVANLCVLGYDPHLYYTGRAPLEAASLGIKLAAEDVAFRCNLVHVEDGVMRDFSAGHIDTGQARELIGALNDGLRGAGAGFFPGLSYRHIMVTKGRGLKAECTPPHDISGQPVAGHLPRGDESDWLRGLMEASTAILADHPVNRERLGQGKAPANMIWLWGQGTAPRMPGFQSRFGLTGSVISAVDLVKGLGIYAGLEVVDVPGATGYLDTDYRAKALHALVALERKDFVYVHVEAPDEAAHMGSAEEKVRAIERFDQDLVGTLLNEMPAGPDYRIMVLPDHATPVEIRTHTGEPVPFLIYRPGLPETPGQTFDEESAARWGFRMERGWELMQKFVSGDPELV